MADKLSYTNRSGEPMSAADEIAADMRAIAFSAAAPAHVGENIKSQMRRGWTSLGKPAWWRFRAAWYGEAGNWSAKAVREFERRDAERREREAKAREQVRALAATYTGAAQRLRQIDSDFHSGEIARLERTARSLGAVDRPGTQADDAGG